MKKRQKKKLLIRAILELNNDVARDVGLPEISREKAVEVYHRVKDSKGAVRSILRDYSKYILNKNY